MVSVINSLDVFGVLRHGVRLLHARRTNGETTYLVEAEGSPHRVVLDQEAWDFLRSLPLNSVVSFGRMPKWARVRYQEYLEALENFNQHGLVNIIADPKHWIGLTLKLVLGCNYGCHYCLPGDAKILMADGTWKPIKDVKEGDYVVGWIRQNTFEPVRVLRTFKRVDTVYRVITEDGETYITDNHPIMGRSRWLAIEPSKVTEVKGAGRLRINSELRYLGLTKNYDETEDYMLGYLSGAFYGDGTYVDQISKGTGRSRYLRLVVKDREFVDRVKKYMDRLGIYYTEGTFRVTSDKSYKKGVYPRIYVTRKDDIARIREIRDSNKEWLRGFVAGFFDAEGSATAKGEARFSNNDVNLLRLVQKGLRAFGFEAYIMDSTKNRKVKTLRLRIINSSDRLRFFTTFRPVVTRKIRRLLHIRSKITRVKGIVEVGTRTVYNLQTESGTYIADGFIVHNCYEAQRMEDDVEKMPKRIIRATLKRVAEFGGGSVAIHGGEPGLYPEGIEYTAKLARKYNERYGSKIRVSIQTNGTAVYTAWDIIREYDIPVGISYDGPYHDKYRVFKDGSPTSEYVLKAIKKLQEANHPYMVISVLDRDADFSKVFTDALEKKIKNIRMNPMYPVGHPILEDKMMPPGKYIQMMVDGLKKLVEGSEVVPKRVREHADPIWGMKPLVCLSIPCQAGLNFFDVDIEGKVAVCDSQPNIKIGDVTKDSVWDWMFHPDSIRFRARWSEFGKPCETCPYKYYCDGGGCEGFLDQMNWPTDKSGPYCLKPFFSELLSLPVEDQLKVASNAVKKVFGGVFVDQEESKG